MIDVSYGLQLKSKIHTEIWSVYTHFELRTKGSCILEKILPIIF